MRRHCQTAATIALEMIGPMLRTWVMTPSTTVITFCQRLTPTVSTASIFPFIELPPVTGKISTDAHHAW